MRAGRASASRLEVLALAFAALSWLLFLPVRLDMPRPGLDPSWAQALNEAVARHLVFGRDIVFTYGPLASIATVYFDPATLWITLLGRLVIASGFCIGLYMIFWRERLFIFFPMPLLLSRLSVDFFDSILILLPFLLFLVVVRLSAPMSDRLQLPFTRLRAAGTAILIGSVFILPLVKGNVAVAVAVDAALSVIVALRGRRRVLAAAIPAIGLPVLCLAWSLAGQPIAALPGYFLSQLPIIAGYSEAMSRSGPLWWVLAAFAVLAGECALCYANAARWAGRFIVTSAFAACLFITFKEGVVREDFHFFVLEGALLLGALILGALLPRGLAVAAVLAVGVAGTALFGVGILARPGLALAAAAQQLVALGDLNMKFDRAKAEIRAATPLPKIEGSADLYPNDLSALLATDIEWRPRPVIQSYSAYTSALAAANADHLLSSDAPDHVFFAVGLIDDRLPSLDDGASWPILLSRYVIAGRNAGYLHLVRVEGASPVRAGEPVAEERTVLGKWIDVPTDLGAVWATVDLEPTILGRAMLTLFRLPGVTIELVLADGSEVRHRYIPEMGRGGFLLSPYVASTEDFLSLAAGAGPLRVRKFRLTAKGSGLWGREVSAELRPLPLPRQPGAVGLVERTPP